MQQSIAMHRLQQITASPKLHSKHIAGLEFKIAFHTSNEISVVPLLNNCPTTEKLQCMELVNLHHCIARIA